MRRSHLQSVPASPASPARGLLQRQCGCGQHHVGPGPCTQCQQQNAPGIVHEVLQGPGQPMDAATRSFMEQRFERDFSQVRVHSDGKAAASAAAVDARAYTTGNDIVFNRGQYAPGTSSGNRVLAHELAHVVQQSASPGTVPRGQALRIGEVGDPFEREAEAISDAVVTGHDLPVHGLASSAVLQRQAPGAAPAPAVPRDTHTPAPPTGDLTSQAHSTSNYGLGIFESELQSFGAGSPCMLTLRLNLFFDFVDQPPPAPPAAYAPTRTLWSAAEQNNWTNAFVRAVTSRWSYRYPLVVTTPDCLWALNICTQAMARVEVIPVPQAGNPDATIRVAHVPASAYRSGAGYGSGDLTQEDIATGGAQVTVEHEFGHLLGLDHSNPACQSTNAAQFPPAQASGDNCYGVTPEQVSDIMGQGSIVTPQDYRPFVQEMNDYTTPCVWKAEGSAPKESKPFGHYGLAILGILGAIGGGIGGGFLGASLAGPGATGAGAAAGAVLGVLGGGLAGAGLGALIDWGAE